MCISNKEIVNPSKSFSLLHHPRLIVRCNCGFCAECRKRKRLEWSIRSQYEFMRCLDHGGFVMFDCLTYSEDKISHFSDFEPFANYSLFNHYCFNRRDLRLFFVNLRRRLSKEGYNIENNLRYFCASEYGEKRTKRCHYHILLFVNFRISPLYLSRVISDCWKYGHTDGLPFKSRRYVLDHNVIKSSVSSVKVANYVSKYVNKPFRQTDELLYYARRLFDDIAHYDVNKGLNTTFYMDKCFYKPIKVLNAWQSCPELNKRYKSLLRQTLPFHIQSKGFGDYALELYDDLDKELSIPLVNNSSIRRVSLPSYYYRRLFYNVVWQNGVRRWIHNQRYVDMMLRNYDKLLNRDVCSVQSVLENMKDKEPDYYNRCVHYLGSRSLYDFCKYKRFYRYRYKSDMFPSVVDIIKESNYPEALNPLLSLKVGNPVLFGAFSRSERFKEKFFSDIYISDNIRLPIHKVSDQLVFDKCYSQESMPEFYDFDYLDEILSLFDSYQRAVAAVEAEMIDRQSERYADILNACAI